MLAEDGQANRVELSFDARRDELKAELEAEGITGDQQNALLENRDEYTAERVFWVPPEARWSNLRNQAARPDIATLIDIAIYTFRQWGRAATGLVERKGARPVDQNQRSTLGEPLSPSHRAFRPSSMALAPSRRRFLDQRTDQSPACRL
ncbi:MAG TPA: type I restriction-modification system subunit M N-terminal domain-containing protein [Opitutales bacterium]|nr:type I restriction-modification system subunit M N-terminal domain-containing protein [Opitutales bacterium]